MKLLCVGITRYPRAVWDMETSVYHFDSWSAIIATSESPEFVVVVFSAVFVDSISSLRSSSSLEHSSMACSVDIIEIKRPKLQSSPFTTNDQWRSRTNNLLWISVSATRLFWSLLWCLGCGVILARLTSKWLIAFSDFQRTIRPMVIKTRGIQSMEIDDRKSNRSIDINR